MWRTLGNELCHKIMFSSLNFDDLYTSFVFSDSFLKGEYASLVLTMGNSNFLSQDADPAGDVVLRVCGRLK